jgi:ADP-L-glycero-D-manno-heptose 6-epimerase
MNILITGGSGFVGSNLTSRLLSENHNITITGTKTENNIPKKIKFLHLSTSDLTKYVNPDVVFHQAANNDTLDYDEDEMLRINYYDPKELFQKLFDNGCKKFIYASSTAVYGNSKSPYYENLTNCNPLNPYAKSKLLFDDFAMEFAKSNNVSVIGLRYCNIYGPNEYHKGHRASMIYQMANKIYNNEILKLFKYGEQKRDYCYVKDVVEANISALSFDGSDIFNIANGNACTFNEIAEILSKILNKKANIEYIECTISDKFQNDIQCNIEKAKKFLKWQPQYTLSSGIDDYMSTLFK